MYFNCDRSRQLDYSDIEQNTESSTDDEEELESDIGDDFVDLASSIGGNSFNFTFDVEQILQNHQLVESRNALSLNAQMRTMLLELRSKIQALLDGVRKKYQENNELLQNALTPQNRIHRNSTLYSAPYFKDKKMYPCWPNDDYIYRRDVRNEFFPINLQSMRFHIWTMADKVALIQGIKKQMTSETDSEIKVLSNRHGKQEVSKLDVFTTDLKTLFAERGDSFEIDWETISVEDLDSRHSIKACLSMWNAYLHVNLNRLPWTKEEDKRLLELTKAYNYQDWILIAKNVGNRSDFQCFVRFHTVLDDFPTSRCKWNQKQDALLLKLVEENRVGGIIKWNQVYAHFLDRKKTAVFNRYTYSIKPGIKKGHFTQKEGCIILAAVEEYGENFSAFPLSLLPGRTIVQIRSHYMNTLKGSKNTKSWDLEDDRKLLQLVSENGTSSWAKIEREFNGQHSRTSCRTRYTVIINYFADNPKATIENIPRKKRGSKRKLLDDWQNNIEELLESSPKETSRRYVRGMPKTTYRDKLRNNERNYYEFFKYSFGYTFGRDNSPEETADLSTFLSTMRICQIQVTANEDGLKKYLPRSIITALQNYMYPNCEVKRENIISKIPPNWSTMLGFRALCILNSTDRLEHIPQKDEKSKKFNEAKYEKSRQLLKERLYSLMYNTAVLSRLNPYDVCSQQRFSIVVSDPGIEITSSNSQEPECARKKFKIESE